MELADWWTHVFRRSRYPLELQVAVLVGLLCVALIGILVSGAIVIGRRDAVRIISANMSELAGNMVSTLDRAMYDRFREVRVIAELGPLRSRWSANGGDVRDVLNSLQASLPAYTWIGFATPDGIVRGATKGLLEGVSVAARPWFSQGLRAPAFGDVHEALLLAKLLGQSENAEPFRFVDVSTPVFDGSGKLAGVLGAHLSWTWADEVRQALLANNESGQDTEISILSSDGKVLLGSRFGASPFDPARLKAMLAEGRGVFEDASASGPVLTGFAVSSGFQDYPGHGWIVVARRPASVAFASVSRTIETTLLLGAGVALLGIVLAWLIARRATAPLLKLTLAARQIGRDPNITMLPRLGGSRELMELSASLRSLLRRIGTAEQRREEAEERSARTARHLTAKLTTLQHEADTDSLTGLLNRRAFLAYAEDALTYYQRYRRTITVLVIDIDFFKRVNDVFGHGAGDDVIRSVGTAITETVRTTDKVARFGGEEFVVLLREVDEDAVRILSERIRACVEASLVRHGDDEIRVTISIGAAGVTEADADIQTLIERADHALYDAKSSGRNRVRLASDISRPRLATAA